MKRLTKRNLSAAESGGTGDNARDTAELSMRHRHLVSGSGFTLAAIDDMIGRGSRAVWERLRDALAADRSLGEKILRVCDAKIADPYEQRYYFWKYHVEHLDA